VEYGQKEHKSIPKWRRYLTLSITQSLFLNFNQQNLLIGFSPSKKKADKKLGLVRTTTMYLRRVLKAGKIYRYLNN